MIDATLVRVINGYNGSVQATRQALIDYLTAAWGGLDQYGDAEVAAWAARVAPVLDAAQARTGALTASYLRAAGKAISGAAPELLALPASSLTSQALRGVDAEQLMMRAGTELWTALSNGHDITKAADMGLRRATSLGETGVEMARVRTSQHVLSRTPGVVGYRRVLGGGKKTCGLCAIASSQRYHKAELMPIHPGCHCSVAPIYGRQDPGRVLEADQLDAVHASLAEAGFDTSSDPAALRELVVVNHHGEIGPVLGRLGHDFTGPSDLG